MDSKMGLDRIKRSVPAKRTHSRTSSMDGNYSSMSLDSSTSSMEGNADADVDYQDANGSANHAPKDEEKSPTPPPHRTPLPKKPFLDPEACKMSGNKYYNVKDFKMAIAEYSKAIEIAPQTTPYLTNRAAAYMAQYSYEEALKDLQTALSIEPDSPKILKRLGRVYTCLGRPIEALESIDKAARSEPISEQDKKSALTMRTYMFQAENAIRDGAAGSMAIHALDMAEKGLGYAAPKPRKWVLMRGEAYLIMGNLNALGSVQEQALSLLRQNGQDPEALVLRGRALYGMGDNAKALLHFKEALSCDPDYKDAVKYLRMVQKLDRMKEEGNLLYKSGKSQKAVQTYTLALEIDPSNKLTNSKILHNRALASLKLKDYKTALSDCERALTLDPSYLKARKTNARALGESGDWEAATREYKAIQESNPGEAGIANDIRHAELELKKSKRKDLYKILGVEKDASELEIKKAYRKLAIVHHPDKNPGDETAAGRFKDINEAHETLSSPEKRARYDSGEDLIDPTDLSSGMGGMPGGVPIDPSIFFNMMGGQGGRPGGGGFSFSTGNGGPGGFPGFAGFH